MVIGDAIVSRVAKTNTIVLTKSIECRQWSLWKSWGECTVACGDGTQSRSRSCDRRRNVCRSGNQQRYEDCLRKENSRCIGQNKESMQCNIRTCTGE